MIGKLRHLAHATTAAGHFCILAIDHRANLKEKLDAATSQPLSDEEFVGFKRSIVESMTGEFSALLIDPAYGIGTGVAQGIIPGQVGLLAPLEVTDYGLHPSQRSMTYIEGWSVGKIKRVGADGVKLLLPYHPEAKNLAEKHDTVERIVEACAKYDLPFYLEPIAYSLDPDTSLANEELSQIVVEMAKTFSDMNADILKMQFPANPDDEGNWKSACERLNAACGVPWALLSAGVDFETFKRQAEVACKAGASGVIVGRAVWAEAVDLQGDARSQFLGTTARQRMAELAAICAAHATPWHQRITIPDVNTGWYESYSDM